MRVHVDGLSLKPVACYVFWGTRLPRQAYQGSKGQYDCHTSRRFTLSSYNVGIRQMLLGATASSLLCSSFFLWVVQFLLPCCSMEKNNCGAVQNGCACKVLVSHSLVHVSAPSLDNNNGGDHV